MSRNYPETGIFQEEKPKFQKSQHTQCRTVVVGSLLRFPTNLILYIYYAYNLIKGSEKCRSCKTCIFVTPIIPQSYKQIPFPRGIFYDILWITIWKMFSKTEILVKGPLEVIQCNAKPAFRVYLDCVLVTISVIPQIKRKSRHFIIERASIIIQ